MSLHSERTSLRTILIAFVALLLGLGLLFISQTWSWLKSIPPLQAIVRDFGSLLVSTVTITILWELAVKRSFLAELMAKAKLAEDIRSAGIVQVTTDFQRDIDWKKMFKTVKNLDIFFAYGRTWRGTNEQELNDFAKRNGTIIRIVLPDYQNKELMNELAKRFEKTPEEVVHAIEEASNNFKLIFKNHPNFSLWLFPESPMFSCYRFDHLIVLALYRHRNRGGVPVFVVEEGGTIYKFIVEEFDKLIEKNQNGLARQIWP
jgi:hypothetical protein